MPNANKCPCPQEWCTIGIRCTNGSLSDKTDVRDARGEIEIRHYWSPGRNSTSSWGSVCQFRAASGGKGSQVIPVKRQGEQINAQRQERDVDHGKNDKGAEAENGMVRCVLCRDSSGCFVQDKQEDTAQTSGRTKVERVAERSHASVIPPFHCPPASPLTMVFNFATCSPSSNLAIILVNSTVQVDFPSTHPTGCAPIL